MSWSQGLLGPARIVCECVCCGLICCGFGGELDCLKILFQKSDYPPASVCCFSFTSNLWKVSSFIRKSLRKAPLYGFTYGIAQSSEYFINAAVFRFGAWLIAHCLTNFENVFMWVYFIKHKKRSKLVHSVVISMHANYRGSGAWESRNSVWLEVFFGHKCCFGERCSFGQWNSKREQQAQHIYFGEAFALWCPFQAEGVEKKSDMILLSSYKVAMGASWLS